MFDHMPTVDDQRDARRFRFIRDYMIQSHSLQMNGQHSYRMSLGWLAKHTRGPTFEDAIDAAMDAMEKYRTPPQPADARSDDE